MNEGQKTYLRTMIGTALLEKLPDEKAIELAEHIWERIDFDTLARIGAIGQDGTKNKE